MPDLEPDPHAFSPRILEKLAHIGWSESWSGDAPRVEAELRAQGFEPHSPALEFIERFGGLSCFQACPYQAADGPFFHTDAVAAAEILSLDRLRRQEEQIGRRLCPLGQCSYAFYLILMDEEGNVYWLNDYDELQDWGHDARDLIENLAGGISLKPLPRSESYPETFRRLYKATQDALDETGSSSAP